MPGNWEDLFDIVEKKNKFYAVFKHSGISLNELSPCKYKVYAESLAYNWANNKNNDKQIVEIMSELILLGRIDEASD